MLVRMLRDHPDYLGRDLEVGDLVDVPKKLGLYWLKGGFASDESVPPAEQARLEVVNPEPPSVEDHRKKQPFWKGRRGSDAASDAAAPGDDSKDGS